MPWVATVGIRRITCHTSNLSSAIIHGGRPANPYNPEDIADALFEALEAPDEDRSARMESMSAWVREHNIYSWAAQYLRALLHLPVED